MSSTHLSTVHTKNHDYHHNDVSIDTDEHQCSVNAKHTHYMLQRHQQLSTMVIDDLLLRYITQKHKSHATSSCQ